MKLKLGEVYEKSDLPKLVPCIVPIYGFDGYMAFEKNKVYYFDQIIFNHYILIRIKTMAVFGRDMYEGTGHATILKREENEFYHLTNKEKWKKKTNCLKKECVKCVEWLKQLISF